MMKKLLLIAFGAMIAGQGFSQTPDKAAPSHPKARLMDASTYESPVSQNREGEIYEWIDFSAVVQDELGGNIQLYGMEIWPDSLAKHRYTSAISGGPDTFAVWFHGAGDMLDMNSEAIGEYYNVSGEVHAGPGRSYVIDGINFGYNYQRVSSVSDTLKIYVFNEDIIDVYQYGDPVAFMMGWPEVSQNDLSDLQPKSYIDSFLIVLDSSYTSSSPTAITSLTLALHDTFEIGVDERIGMVMHYFPGQTYTDGISLTVDNEIDMYNIFSPIMMKEDGGASSINFEAEPFNLTSGIIATGRARYNNDTTQNAAYYNGHYTPSINYTSETWAYEHGLVSYHVGAVGNYFIATKDNRNVTFVAKDNFGANDFTWDLGYKREGDNSNVQAGSKEFTHEFPADGVYTVELRSKVSGTSKSYTYSERVTVLSIGIEEEYTAFDVFPNPANDVLNINIATVNNGIDVAIYNMLGQEVYRNNSFSNSFNNTVDVSNFTKGVYTVVVNNNNQPQEIKVVID